MICIFALCTLLQWSNINYCWVESTINDENICHIDNATIHTIFKDKKYLSFLIIKEANVSNIYGSIKLIDNSTRAIILLSKGTEL